MNAKFLISVAAALLFAACVKESAPLQPGMTTVAFSFVTDGTKSSCVLSESAVENVLVAWYKDGILSGTSSVNGVSGNVSVRQGDYDFYAVANMEGFVFPQLEADLGSEAACLDGPSDLQYIPMAAGPVLFSAPLSGNSITFNSRRLAARFNFTVDSSSLPGSFQINSLRIRQNSSRLQPFSSSSAGSPAETFDCDMASAADLSLLNSGSSISLYVPENIKGNHASIDSPEKKDYDYVESNISAALASTATYLELCGEWSGNGVSAPVTYRMYLGANPCDDFNVIGNKEYDITLRFSTDPLDQLVNGPVPIWMMEVSVPDDRREVCWDNSCPFILPGGYETLNYSVSPDGVGYEIVIDDGITLVDGESVRGDSGIWYCLNREGRYVEISRNGNDTSSGIIACHISTTDGLNTDEATIYKLGFNNSVCYFAFSDDYSEQISDSGVHAWDYDFSDVVFVSDFDPYSIEMSSSVRDHSIFTEYGSGRILFRLCDYYYDFESDKLSAVYSIDLDAMKEADNLYVWLWNLSERTVGKSISVDIEYDENGGLCHTGDALAYSLTPYTGKKYPIYASSTWNDVFTFEENFYRSGSQYYYPVAALDQCIVSAYSEYVSLQQNYVVAHIGESYTGASGSVSISPYGGNTATYDTDGLVYFNLFKFYGNIPGTGVESVSISIN